MYFTSAHITWLHTCLLLAKICSICTQETARGLITGQPVQHKQNQSYKEVNQSLSAKPKAKQLKKATEQNNQQSCRATQLHTKRKLQSHRVRFDYNN